MTIKESSSKTQDIDISMICTNAYCAAYYLEEAKVFAMSIKDI